MPTERAPRFWIITDSGLYAPVLGGEVGFGPFTTKEEAEDYIRRELNGEGTPMAVVPPALTPAEYQARLVKSGFYSGTGPFEDEA